MSPGLNGEQAACARGRPCWGPRGTGVHVRSHRVGGEPEQLPDLRHRALWARGSRVRTGLDRTMTPPTQAAVNDAPCARKSGGLDRTLLWGLLPPEPGSDPLPDAPVG